MDKIDKFEKILTLVERARKLDFIAIEVMEKMNKQHIDFYKFYNKITFEPNEQEVGNKEIKNSNVMDIDNNKTTDTVKEKEDEMTDHNDALKAFVEAFNNQINKCKLNPAGPIPPDEEIPEEQPSQQQQQQQVQSTPSLAQEHLTKMDKIKGYSAIICDRVKTQSDMIKYMQSVVVETHRMAFDMYKDMDDYLKKNPPNNTVGTNKT